MKTTILVGLILHRAAPAVTRRKEYDQITFGHILSCGTLGANVLFCFLFNINSIL
ncbi:MAG TPA: hypothetical protein VI423_03860 [Paenisporosarcina sp.]|nr:hypothetical protein [Paenisporosarcina sp.]